MENKIQEKIESKIQALQNLTAKLNKAEDDTKKGLNDLDKMLEDRRVVVFEQLAKLEKKLDTPEESIVLVHEELRQKEKDLVQWRDEVQGFVADLDERESALNEHESLLTVSGGELLEAWTELLKSMYSGLRSDLDSLKFRESMLANRKKGLDNKQDLLHDQVRTFKAAQIEILRINDGK